MATHDNGSEETPLFSRLAVLERGEAAIRILSAVENLSPGNRDIGTLLVHARSMGQPWYAREADEVLQVGHDGQADPEPLTNALLGAGADMVWPSRSLCRDHVRLVESLEKAGLTVVGPSSAVLARLVDPPALARVAQEAGVALSLAPRDPSTTRSLDVTVLRDVAGASWVLGPRESSVRRGDATLIAETPAAFLPAGAQERMQREATALFDAVGYVGGGVVRFALDTSTDELVCSGVNPGGCLDTALLQVVTGVDLAGLLLRIAAGQTLPDAPPRVDGHAVEARVLAIDPEAGHRPTGGTIQLFTPPTGAGVYSEIALREGDTVDATLDPLIASVSAWGQERAEAIARVRVALDRLQLVVSAGATNRTALLGLLAQHEFAAGPVPAAWYDDLVASGATAPTPDPVAIVAAAVEIYETDLAEVRRSFRASAARGRPQHPERVGRVINVAYRGARHRLKVDKVAASTYRVHDGVGVDVTVERLGDYARRLTVAGRKHRVIAVPGDDQVRLEINGVSHTVVRQDGVVLRTAAPALVASVLVEPGQRVIRGQGIAVLESMKMVTTVTSTVDGVVAAVAVLPTEQVDTGVPLVRIRADAGHAGAEERAAADEDAVTLDRLAPPAGARRPIFERLRDCLLGYDIDGPNVAALVQDYRALVASRHPDDAGLRADEDMFCDLFADVGSLYRPRTEAESDDHGAQAELGGQSNTQEYFLAFLTWLDADRAGLSLRYRARLERALARYGVRSLDDGDAVEAATLWMFRSFERVPTLASLVVEMLVRRLYVGRSHPKTATPQLRGRLERLIGATEGRQREVADLARDVLFHLYEEPVLDRAEEDSYLDSRARLQALGTATGDERLEHVGALVARPYPLRPVLLEAWLALLGSTDETAPAVRDGVLTTYLRRYYRTRKITKVGSRIIDGFQLAHCEYLREGATIHVVVAYGPLSDVPRLARAVATHLSTEAFQCDAVVEVVAWDDDTCPDDSDDTVAALDELLLDADFGRALRRLDITLTYLQGEGGQQQRTRHATYRSADDGRFAEDKRYRNLHPMLAKRLDLWRLSTFELTRLPSPEDVYVFDGVARENLKDRRVFALGEIRDLEPLVDERTGATTYPRLGRVGLEALAAMRAALARHPARERPTANRLVLLVRPVWDIPAEQWHDLFSAYEGLARGTGLQKVVLHVKLPERAMDGTTTIEDRVLTLEGLGGGGLSVRVSEVGPNPVRPLTPYAQKVLTAARFGSPYPYEIVRMLTPAPSDASTFPPGSFQELDLGPDDELAPVDREPGRNQAHLVVGLISNITDVHPEGMSRVAILSDPTQGLGNLAEPECRRINAALRYALARQIPLEWYAVSSGALIALDSGTENMDWISNTLREIIEYTQAGGEINIIVTGINVGGQPYWNAESTMLMHTRGILIMTPASTMVLTGKQALDFSGAVSADDNDGIGGYDRIMGPNGQAQYWAPSFPEACSMLLRHYDYTYVVPGERFPRRRPTNDPAARDVRSSPHAPAPGSTFTTVGDIFDMVTNPERKSPFDMRSLMRAVVDTDCEPLERWKDWQDADTIITWDGTVGGIPVCLLAMESHRVQRRGFVPSYGPPAWTAGTLFPQSARKASRTINATSGNRPLVVLANLSGFDGSPESMRNWQLEYGAEIGRSITNFKGPIVFVVVSRYHGGAFVVFSKQLNSGMVIAAVEGSYASVIGGAPAAATVFAREVKQRTEKDSRVVQARAAAATASGAEAGALRAAAARTLEVVRSERLREVADEFDAIHTIERAQRVGSVDKIIPAETIRPFIIDALERGMAASEARG